VTWLELGVLLALLAMTAYSMFGRGPALGGSSWFHMLGGRLPYLDPPSGVVGAESDAANLAAMARILEIEREKAGEALLEQRQQALAGGHDLELDELLEQGQFSAAGLLAHERLRTAFSQSDEQRIQLYQHYIRQAAPPDAPAEQG
jgi:hypothetical protein